MCDQTSTGVGKFIEVGKMHKQMTYMSEFSDHGGHGRTAMTPTTSMTRRMAMSYRRRSRRTSCFRMETRRDEKAQQMYTSGRKSGVHVHQT